jgi:penicillin amidase
MNSKKSWSIYTLLFFISFYLIRPYFSRYDAISQIEKTINNNLLKNELQAKECQLFDDVDGIPHIKAESELEAYACWGFIQTRDRAAQMELLRRTAYGKKAEVGSYQDIKSDFFIRIIGISEKAEEIFAQMSPNVKKLLWAYSYGVNKALSESIRFHKVYQFEKLQIFPEPWIPENSIALLLLQSLEQTKDNFIKKLDEENSKNNFGSMAQMLFSKENLPWETYITKEDDPWTIQMKTEKKSQTVNTSKIQNYQLNTQKFKELRHELFPEENWGSNSWVLSPSRTESKKAWLANDPHLNLKNPPFWYWLHIETTDFNMIGATLAGTPSFANGTNSFVSWGLTNSYLPAGNVYLVSKKEMASDNKISSSRPLIWFKFWKFEIPFFFKSYEKLNSKWPILPIELNPELNLIYHWSSLDLSAKDLEPLFDLVKTKSVKEINIIFSDLKLNSWNFVFADIEGNIGYRATGLIHRLEQKQDFGISVKSYSDILKTLSAKNYLSSEEMPHLFNPKRDYVVTANNRQWKQDLPFYLGSSNNSEFRAHRIEELLTSDVQLMNLEKIKSTQCDNQAQDARVFLPLINDYLKISSFEKDKNSELALNILNSWDLKTTTQCKECFLFRRWLSLIYENEHLNVIALYKILTDSKVFDKKHFSVNLLKYLNQSFNEYSQLIKNGSNWGNLHVNQFASLWGDDFKNTESLATPGDEETVNPGTADYWDGQKFKHRSGASQRLIIEMTNPPKVYSTLAGENTDIEIPPLNDSNYSWKKWSDCQLSQKSFPLDWSAHILKKIIL